MGENPGPTTNGWCSTGNWADEEPPLKASDVLPTAVLDEDVSCAVIGEANVEIKKPPKQAENQRQRLPELTLAHLAGQMKETMGERPQAHSWTK